jgi:hypothetical protein
LPSPRYRERDPVCSEQLQTAVFPIGAARISLECHRDGRERVTIAIAEVAAEIQHVG